MSKSVFLVVTSAVLIAGEIARPDDLVEVSEAEAANLTRRGKAREATEAEAAEAKDAAELAAMEAAEAAKVAKASAPKSGSKAAADKDG